jgi:hypothetical protein
MIGAYNPRPFVSSEFFGALTTDFPQIPDPVKQYTHNEKAQRRNQENGHSS